jgi:preprotein translocase subunit SecG
MKRQFLVIGIVAVALALVATGVMAFIQPSDGGGSASSASGGAAAKMGADGASGRIVDGSASKYPPKAPSKEGSATRK